MRRLPLQFLSGAGLLIASLFVGNVCNFLFNAYLGRALSFEQFGLVTFIITLWNLISIPVGSLSASINYRAAFLSSQENKTASLHFYRYFEKRILLLTILFSILWIIITPFVSQYFDISPIVLWMITPSFAAGAIGSAVRGYFSGIVQFGIAGFLVFLEAAIKLGAGIVLVSVGVPQFVYLAVPLSIVVPFVVAEILLFSFSDTQKISPKGISHQRFPRRFFVVALLSGLASAAFLSFDVILAKHYFDPKLAGEYAFLSLVGKMVFFLGSLINSFVVSYVRRDEAMGRDSNNTFYRFLGITVGLTLVGYGGVGLLGRFTLPILFGSKALVILPFLPEYTLAIALYTISSYVVFFHLAKKQYLFSVLALVMAGFVAMGITQSHASINSITGVLLLVSIINFFVTALLHFLQRNGEFVLRNLVDLIDVFFPLAQTEKQSGVFRILVFNWRDTHHVFAGGAEVYIQELAKRWVSQGHQVTVFCGNDSKSARNDTIDGVRIIRRGGFYFVYLWAFIYYITKFRGQFDVIIDCQNGIPFFTPLYVKEKVVCVVHHIHQEVFRTNLFPPLAIFAQVLENRLMPFVYRNVQFVTVSKSTKKEMEALSMQGVGISTIHNGIDMKVYHPGQKSKHPLVVYVGRLKHYKSLPVLLHSFAKIIQTVPEARCVIAGEGEEKKSLEKITHGLGIDHAVSFVGKVTEKEKVALYQQAWVFVNPSAMEGWGITTIEANACKTPVVASFVPGLKDSVVDGKTGLLIPFGDINAFAVAIETLLTQEHLRQQMSAEAILWAQQFSWDLSAEKFLRILQTHKQKVTAPVPVLSV